MTKAQKKPGNKKTPVRRAGEIEQRESALRQLLNYLAPYSPDVSNLTLALRDLVLEEAPQAIESISKGYALAIGYSFTGRPLKDGFCHIVTYSTHVNLGFNRGALLPDPNGILAGKGKSIRHISIRSESELEWPFVRRYLRTAIDMIGGPLTPSVGLSRGLKKQIPKHR